MNNSSSCNRNSCGNDYSRNSCNSCEEYYSCSNERQQSCGFPVYSAPKNMEPCATQSCGFPTQKNGAAKSKTYENGYMNSQMNGRGTMNNGAYQTPAYSDYAILEYTQQKRDGCSPCGRDGGWNSVRSSNAQKVDYRHVAGSDYMYLTYKA